MTHRPINATRTGNWKPCTWTPPARPSTDDIDIDWIAVERAIHGDLPEDITNEEKREAALILFHAGLGEQAIANRLGTYTYLVAEWKASAGLLPPERICTIPQCGHAARGHGLCSNHLNAAHKQQRQADKAARQAPQNQLEVAA